MALKLSTRFIRTAGAVWALVLALNACNGQRMSSVLPEAAVLTVQSILIGTVIELHGVTTASVLTEVRPQVTGTIKRVLVSEGSNVKAGQLLFEVDAPAFKPPVRALRWIWHVPRWKLRWRNYERNVMHPGNRRKDDS